MYPVAWLTKRGAGAFSAFALLLSGCALEPEGRAVPPYGGTYALMSIERGTLPFLSVQDSTFKQYVEGARVIIFPNDSGVVAFRVRAINANGYAFLGATTNPFHARLVNSRLVFDFADPRINTNFADTTVSNAQHDLVVSNRGFGLGPAYLPLGALTFRRILLEPPPGCHRPRDIECSLFY